MNAYKFIVSDTFEPLLHDQQRYLVLMGGRGSGKSEFAARKILMRCLQEGHHRFLVLRKVRKSLERTVIKVIRMLLLENGITYNYNKTEHAISFNGPKGISEILFDGLDDPEKIKSIKGITSIWIEEATELTKDEFLTVDLCLRELGPGYKQIMLSFNPQEVDAPWLKEMFFGPTIHANATVHRSTVEDNPIAEFRVEYGKRLDALKEENPTMYKIARLGEWAALEGRIYHWDVQPLPLGQTDAEGKYHPFPFDEVWCGLDFGYSVDPSAVVEIYRRSDELWIKLLVYEKKLTNQALGDKMRQCGVTNEKLCYCDAAEPKSIEELRRQGFFVLPADKGQDSVRTGIDFLKSLKIHIVEGSPELYKEASNYCWRKDKKDNFLPEPVKLDDHALDAARYGIFTHMWKHRGRGAFEVIWA